MRKATVHDFEAVELFAAMIGKPEPETDEETTDLIPLEEHNRRLQQKLLEQAKRRPNGIACPECGAELYDVQDNMTLLSHPPQYRIHCFSCNYHGTRF